MKWPRVLGIETKHSIYNLSTYISKKDTMLRFKVTDVMLVLILSFSSILSGKHDNFISSPRPCHFTKMY